MNFRHCEKNSLQCVKKTGNWLGLMQKRGCACSHRQWLACFRCLGCCIDEKKFQCINKKHKVSTKNEIIYKKSLFLHFKM